MAEQNEKNSVVPNNRFRILAVDDEEHILEAFRSILCPGAAGQDETRFEELQAKLFGKEGGNNVPPLPTFDVVTCRQGKEAVKTLEQAVDAEDPFAAVFLDMRMPPGPDGLWTAQELRAIDPMVNIIIVTAYSDVHPQQIVARVEPADKLLYIQKPFHGHEILQLAVALSAKWQAENELININEMLEEKVEERTSELASAMSVLQEEIEIRKIAEDARRKAEADLQQKAIDLEATNTALHVLFRQKNEERKAIETKIVFNLREMVLPYVQKLKKVSPGDNQQSIIDLIETNLQEVLTPFMHQMSQKFFRLTPQEISIANMIKTGKKTREIAEVMGTSKRTVDFHRDRIREKIGIKNKKANLKVVLLEFDLDEGEEMPTL